MNTNVALSFCYFFLVMASYYTLKPVREAFFLDSEGVSNFPVVHILLVFVTYAAARVYDALARRYRGGWLASRTVPVIAACILIYWGMLRASVPGSIFYRSLVWTYYLGVSLHCVFAVAFFWSLTHAVFTPEQGKRCYGLIGVGGILGSGAGGFLTRFLVPHVGSVNLLLVSAALIMPCLALGLILDGRRLGKEVRSEEKPRPVGNSLSLLWNDRYVGGIALLVFLVLGFEELGDHQTQRLLKEVFHLKGDELTQFYGNFYIAMNAWGLFVSVFLTRFLLTRFGPAPGLLIMPCAAAIKCIAVLLWPTRDVLLVTLSLDLGLFYSLYQASKELLYTPTSDDVRFRAKTMIDTFMFRLGAGVAAILVLTVLLGKTQTFLSLFILFYAAASAVVAWRLHRQFKEKTA